MASHTLNKIQEASNLSSISDLKYKFKEAKQKGYILKIKPITGNEFKATVHSFNDHMVTLQKFNKFKKKGILISFTYNDFICHDAEVTECKS